MKTLESHLKVAIISLEYPPFFFGGIGSYCYNLAMNLAKKGISTAVFTGRSNKIARERINDSLEIIRLPYLDFPPRPLWFQLQNLKIISKHLNEYDVIHIANPVSGAAFAYIAKKLRKPIVTTLHSVPSIYTLKSLFYSSFNDLSLGDVFFELFEYQLRMSTLRFSLINSNHIISCGFYALDKMKTYFDLDVRKASVIHNGISFDQMETGFLSPADTDFKRVLSIFYSGRLFYFKGVTYLLRALALLKQSLPNFKAEIFGNGPLRGKIEKLKLRLGLRNNVHLRGFVNDHKRFMKEIRRADIVAIPSLHEVGPSISALEAMAYKKPVVAFDLPFSRELIVNRENGLLAKPYDFEDFASKLYLLCSDANLRTKLGWNAYNYVKEKHNWSILVDSYSTIYEMVLS